MSHGFRLRGLPIELTLALAVAAVGVSLPSVRAQAPARGQNVVPVFEGFWKNADGTADLLFGYYNRNWEEEIDIPVGPANTRRLQASAAIWHSSRLFAPPPTI